MRRAAPAFEILMLAPVRHFFPEQRQRLNGGWRRARALHPSEDLSELPPLRSVVAGQEYHCPRTRSLRGSLPKLLLDGWVPLVTLLGRLYAGTFLPHRWSSRILRIAVPFLAHPLDVIQSLDMYFSSCTRRTEKVPSMHRPRETSVYKGYKQDKIEMRGDRAEMSDFPLYLNMVAGGLDRRDQTIGGFSFVVKIYALPVVEIIG